MKKILAIVIAAALMLAAIPAFAFTGFDTDPEAPVLQHSDEQFFPVEINRVENEPEVSENEWGEQVNTWIPMDNGAAIAAGDTVTVCCEFTVPETIEGFEAEALSQIEVMFEFTGLDDADIIDAVGLDANYTCDYDAGYCYPLPGYGNAVMEEGVLVVLAHLGTTVKVIVQGVASDTEVECQNYEIIGQFAIPASFSVGKLVKEDGGWYVYYKDLFNAQIRGMKYFAEDGVFDHYYVCLNEHDYIRSVELRGVVYTEVGNDENVITEGPKFDALELAYNTYMDFFGFTDDGVSDVLTDNVFLAGSEPEIWENLVVLGTSLRNKKEQRHDARKG